jgi:hypothetical protein
MHDVYYRFYVNSSTPLKVIRQKTHHNKEPSGIPKYIRYFNLKFILYLKMNDIVLCSVVNNQLLKNELNNKNY